MERRRHITQEMDRPAFAAPRLEPAEFPQPVKLRREADKVARRMTGVGALKSNDENKREALRRVDLVVAGGSARLERQHVGAILELLPGRSLPWKQAATEMVLRDTTVGWRKLWILWQEVGSLVPGLTAVLAERLTARCAESKAFAQRRLPKWLPWESGRIAEALAAPEEWSKSYCSLGRVPLSQVATSLEVSPTLPLGRVLIANMVRNGETAWWRLEPRDDVLDWTEGRPEEIVCAVADRVLYEHGVNASSPADVAIDHRLTAWVRNAIGDPHDHPGLWRAISERSQQVYEWLVVRAEAGKILDEFRRNAERERADFWEGYLTHLQDARYHTCGGTAVCLMVIGDLLFVEFGTTGNACYIYDAPPRRLRAYPMKKKGWVGDFKRVRGLELGNDVIRYVKKLSHMSGWTGKFEDLLYSRCHVRRRRRTIR